LPIPPAGQPWRPRAARLADKILGGKTGHTDAAGYCLIIEAEIDHRAVVMAFLGGKTSDARFTDFAKVVRWLARPTVAAAPRSS